MAPNGIRLFLQHCATKTATWQWFHYMLSNICFIFYQKRQKNYLLTPENELNKGN